MNCGHESRGAQTREILRWTGPATNNNYRPALSSERALNINKQLSEKNFMKKNVRGSEVGA
jgi:hypothetical protein